MKINYSIKALIGLIGVYFLLKDITHEDNKSPNYTSIFYLLLIVFVLFIINLIVEKNKKEIKIDYDLEINKIISSNLSIDQKVTEIDKILNIKSNYGQKMHLLNQKERDLVYIENLQREVNNGGFNQFYFNTSGNYALETEKAYKKIKAHKTALIIERANNEFPNNFIPSDRENRIKILLEIEGKAENTWNECNNTIFNGEEYYYENLYNYFTSK